MAEIKKLAIANRGEIARRIIVTAREMGIKTALLHAAGDTHNEAFRLADERICIGPADPLQSYLDIEKNIEGALSAGAQAIHPGYGFLSENPEFAGRCESRNLIFIGPPSQTISLLGNKTLARRQAEKAGIPVLPAWTGSFEDESLIKQKAKEIAYPLMIKAAGGGGGRGLRRAYSEEELLQLLPIVQSEALQSFNNEEIFLEKYLDSAKHIEAQIFVSADKEMFVLGDRDCSLQRRHQKIIEEAPSSLPKKMKGQMEEACRALCEGLDYKGAGTVEFLVQGDHFYFLEVNTRLQVEHTVTEMIYGVNLVRAQILTAMGRPAFFSNSRLESRGHSIQCRVCAEDPEKGFLPSAGPLLACLWPHGKSARVDTAYHSGDQISSFYDSLIGKIIVWDDSRVRAIEKMKLALEGAILFGLASNISFLSFLLSHNEFVNNTMTINSLESIRSSEWGRAAFPLPEKFVQSLFQELKGPAQSRSAGPVFNPWSDFLKKKS